MNEMTMIWDEVISMLNLKLNKIQLKNWIQPLVPLYQEEDLFVFDSTSSFIRSMVQKNYQDKIEECLSYICQRPIHMEMIDPSSPRYEKDLNKAKLFQNQQKEEQRKEGFEDFYPRSSERENERKKKDQLRLYQEKNGYKTLNHKYTLENFVRGPSNDFAYAAASAVINHPGSLYNPLFIYGLSGLGKTHLMQAIAHEILKKDPTKTVFYITSENFMNEMIATIEDGSNKEKENFRRKYRSIDVLLIDDIQFIAGKKATMEEIFHTFNDLKEANKQIILSADKPPKELKNLEERLVTRFEGGMTVDIQQPDFETRVAILNHKMKEESLTLPAHVVDYIA